MMIDLTFMTSGIRVLYHIKPKQAVVPCIYPGLQIILPLLGPRSQSRFGDKLPRIIVLSPLNGTAVLKEGNKCLYISPPREREVRVIVDRLRAEYDHHQVGG